jgi:antitoxin ParD1/3/4
MGTVCKTITLTDKQASWINAQIEAGHYANDSDCVSELIRCEQERSDETIAIHAALIEGEASGEPRAFDAAAKQLMLATHG